MGLEAKIKSVNTSAAANASWALSNLAGQTYISVAPPEEKDVKNLDPIFYNILETEAMAIVACISFAGDVEGRGLLIYPADGIDRLCDYFLKKAPGGPRTLTPLDYSALAEAGNIAISSYFSAMANALQMEIVCQPPDLWKGTVTDLCRQLVIEPLQDVPRVIVIKVVFHFTQVSLKGWLFFFLEGKDEKRSSS